MKVLLVNGSPRREGNTARALGEVAAALKGEGLDAEIFWIGNKAVQGCVACARCRELGHCVFTDEVYTELCARLGEADAVVIGSPVYYAGPAGALCALLDRVFYSAGAVMRYKPAASVVVCRRGGASAAFDRLNKYFEINCMPVVSSQYWNMAYGALPGEAGSDAEGMQTMRTLGRNMAWLLRKIHASGPDYPQPEKPERTNFIR